MQPSNGGFWHPNNPENSSAKTEGQSSLDERAVAPPSKYEGYDLANPAPAIPVVDPLPTTPGLKWEASEYIQHEKDIGWFIILIAIAATLFGLALLFRQWTFAPLVIAMTVSIIVYARRPPRILRYELSADHFSIEDRTYPYHDFKAFSLTKDGPLHMITLIPRKRFAPPVSMYFEEKDGEQIVDIVGSHMPLEPARHDLFDELVRKLRF